jgi:hypothetical protein
MICTKLIDDDVERQARKAGSIECKRNRTAIFAWDLPIASFQLDGVLDRVDCFGDRDLEGHCSGKIKGAP